MKYIILTLALINLSSCYDRHMKTGYEGQLIPPLPMLLIDKMNVTDTKLLKPGKPVIFLYIDVNCPNSRALIDQLSKDINLFNGMELYMLSSNTVEDLKNYKPLHKLNTEQHIKIAIDYKDSFGDYFKIEAVPFIAIYGKDLKLRETFLGSTSLTKMKAIAYS